MTCHDKLYDSDTNCILQLLSVISSRDARNPIGCSVPEQSSDQLGDIFRRLDHNDGL